MRKTVKWTAATAMASLLILATACGSNNNEPDKASNAGNNGKAPANNAANTGDNAANTPANAANSPAEGDPYLGKYDPPITLTSVRIINDTIKFMEGQTIDNNMWTKALEEKLGIKIKYDWVVSGDQPGGQGEQKMNVSIASGDLPEVIPVNAKQLQQLQDAGELEDMTAIYDKYASPFLKEILNQDGPAAISSATFGGKLMAIPNTGSSMDGAAMIWIRTDWLKKLGLEPPKTMDDVLKISEAFTTQDPDGNKKNDSYGIAMNKDLYGGFADITGLLNGYHAYPKQWIKDASGNIVYGSIQPEMKTALATLQEMYKKGEIDKEFGVKDGGKEAELTSSGRIGMEFGQMWNPLFPLVDNKKNDPNAQWQSFPLVSSDDQAVTPQVGFSTGQYFAVKKGAEHPEAVVKAMNLFVETGWGETTTPENYAAYFTSEGFEKFKMMPFQAWPSRKNLDIYLHVTDAIKTKDTSKLNAEEKDNYGKIAAFLDGSSTDALGWAYERIFATEGSFKVIDGYVSNNQLKMTEFYGAPTPAMVEKDSNLQKREIETFTKIIMGDPIDNFDKFVTEWKKLGGDQITQEVNDWAKNK
ncbi:extracellular solute-binding protein [Paenibacillus sacheonensis]|uniref:Extracellular solute-binding protein n=1 Tax=Paenibacillus sacheonensis TaxID=742054 RepID=A0A7X4YT77_9BACL|nr:extracellular solute-binding protein [Paenibacillus sacheonensis]MBM7568430.1 putative aldouronate transport system substrate-binding protein [Paenibacillus sacheonensis]NBC72128.1 extracellular solute-binding protein [Paenibacillus sacheonensis]